MYIYHFKNKWNNEMIKWAYNGKLRREHKVSFLRMWVMRNYDDKTGIYIVEERTKRNIVKWKHG